MATRVYIKGQKNKSTNPAHAKKAATKKSNTAKIKQKHSSNLTHAKKTFGVQKKSQILQNPNAQQPAQGLNLPEPIQISDAPLEPIKLQIPPSPPAPMLKISDAKKHEAHALPKGEFFDKKINLSHPNFEQFMFYLQETTHIFEKNNQVQKNSLAKAAISSLNFESATSLTMRADGEGNQTLITKIGKKEVQLAQGKDFTSMHIAEGKSITHIIRKEKNTEVIHFS